MLAGRFEPGLGGSPELLDVIGVNYYWNNQQEYGGPTLPPDDPRRRPLRAMLADVYARYQRPIFLAETSIEGDGRAAWLRHVGEELRAALKRAYQSRVLASTRAVAPRLGRRSVLRERLARDGG
jgi:hypothetical protein